MACTEIENILNKFNDYTEKPVKFLTVQSDRKDDIKTLVKSLYDYTKAQEKNVKREKKGALPKLIVEDFDEEQIWQQIELQNSECWDHLVWEVANNIAAKDSLIFPVSTSGGSEDDGNDESDDNPMSEDETQDENDKVSSAMIQKKPASKPKSMKPKRVKSSIVDDEFFNLKDMEKFLLKEEKNEGKTPDANSDEESIDMFEDIEDDDDGSDEEVERKDVMYNDFFDRDDGDDYENDPNDEDMQDSEYDDDQEMNDDGAPSERDDKHNKNSKKVRFAQESSNDEDESTPVNDKVNNALVNEKKSEFELRQQRLKQTIDRLEDKTMKEAPWQLKGEVDATRRPQNSLLQEVVDFDLTSRPPPIITEQTTITLEDIIMRRIKDKAWDDVVKKEKPVDDQLNFRKKEIIDQSKSKLSLAQVYEAEYLKQKQALSGDNEEEKEPESHTEIRDAMNKLFAKLDALCHYHYTPKAPQAEVKIVTNTPAISMEEVAPVATSDATLLAPEEVKKKNRGDLMSKEERSQTDKNRERRKKKKLQKGKGKVEKVTNHRNTKMGVEANDKSLKTSKAFFQQLNDDSTSLLKKGKRNVKNKGQ